MADVLNRLRAAVAERYHVEREVGRGGMATVYLARDPKHDRQVALKVLHPELTAVLGPERFLREIRIAAKLNHPHILPMHDSGQADSFLYYVMPYIEGESLRAKLNRETQLPVVEALEIGRQVASALDYAHRHDIIHRDIKPENVLLQEGEAMVADFGIALAVHAAAGERLTETGLSLGTPEYMSPEQATGDRRLDGRSDIYSLGCVLYELLAGEAPHTGPTAQAIVAKVLTERAPNLRALRDTVPEAVEHAVMKALAKLPADRFASAGDFAEVLTAFTTRATPAFAQPGARPARPASWHRVPRAIPWRQVLPWGAAVLAAAVAVWSLWRSSRPAPQSLARLVVALPPGLQLVGGPSPPLTLSPDGTRLVYAAHSGGRTQLYVRALDEFETRAMPGTDGATAPFFSADGEWVGFFADGKLKKVPVAGGTPLTVSDAPWSASWGFAGTWGADDKIIFAPGLGSGLLRVPARGGTPEELTTPRSDEGEVGHAWPQVLPNGKDVLFIIGTREGRNIALLSLETGEWHTVLRGSAQAAGVRYLPTGHLVYAQSGALLAVPLDVRRREARGSSVSVLDSVYTFGSGLAYFTISHSGSLVYAPGSAVTAENVLVWVDRDGRATPLAGDPGTYLYPRVSPDGTRVAVGIQEGGNRDIWVYDVESRRRTRLTVEGVNTDPVWTPDGERITFASNRAGPFNLYWRPADASGPAQPLLIREGAQFPHSWSPDGLALTFYQLTPTTARDMWAFSADSATPLLATAFNERSPLFSPDGRWLAYTSNESGRDEVYVQPWPEAGARWTISIDGGAEPVWSADGRELSYRHGDKVMVVDVTTEPTFSAGQPRQLFEGRYDVTPMSSGSLNYDVSPDGRRFVMIERDEESVPNQLHVVLNWFEELERLVPSGRE